MADASANPQPVAMTAFRQLFHMNVVLTAVADLDRPDCPGQKFMRCLLSGREGLPMGRHREYRKDFPSAGIHASS